MFHFNRDQAHCLGLAGATNVGNIGCRPAYIIIEKGHRKFRKIPKKIRKLLKKIPDA
jgi:hypothetical protein